MDAQELGERLLVAVLDAGAAHHLRADETCAEAAALAAEGLHAHAGHGGQDEAGGNLDEADPPGRSQVDHGPQIVLGTV